MASETLMIAQFHWQIHDRLWRAAGTVYFAKPQDIIMSGCILRVLITGLPCWIAWQMVPLPP